MISRTSDTSRAQAWSDARSLPTVHLIPVRGADANGQLELPGTMAAWNTAHIFARVPGYVRSWDRDIGAPWGWGRRWGGSIRRNWISRSSRRGRPWRGRGPAPALRAARRRAGTTC
jgi:hypothetical protein